MTATSEKTLREHLMLALAVIMVGGVALGWVGGKAVDYTFDDVRDNSDFRVSQIQKNQSDDKRMDNMESLMRSLIDNSTVTRESVIRIEERLDQWEAVNQ